MGESSVASLSRTAVKRVKQPVISDQTLTTKEEPRRSSRANKGSNSDRWQEVLDSARQNIVQPESNAGDTATDAGTVQNDNDDENDNDAGEDRIRCVCGQTQEVEDEDKDFVQCDQCLVWQHNQCVGLPSDIPENQDYFCELCRPDLHQKLLKDIASGKKSNLDKKRKRAASPAKKRVQSVRSPTPPSEDDLQLKRQRSSSVSDISIVSDDSESEIMDAKTRRTGAASAAAAARAASTLARSQKKSTASKSKSKSGKGKTNSASARPSAPHKTLSEIHDPDRKKIATALVKLIGDTFTIATETEGFVLSDNVSVEKEALSLGLQIEFAMFDAHLDVRVKFRQLSFNLKDPKNPALRKSVLDRSLKPVELVQMSSEDMANPELKAKTEALREESLKQSVLVQESGPRIRRTHKGEEYVEGPDAALPTSSIVADNRPRVCDGSDSPLSVRSAPSTGDSETGPNDSPPVPKRERSDSNFDIKNVWEHMEDATENGETPALQRRPSRPESALQSNDNDDDEDLLGLLNDDQKLIKSYNYASSTQVWNGQLLMPGVSDLTATVTLLGGPKTFDVDWPATLTSCIKIDGRIPKPDASKYLCHQKYSTSKTVFVLQIRAQAGKEEALQNLYSYFIKKDRYGVIKPGKTRLRDGYIIPLPADAELPEFITMLPSFNLPADRGDLLLAVLVVEKSAASSSAPTLPTAVPLPSKSVEPPQPESLPTTASPLVPASNQQPFTVHQWQAPQAQYTQPPSQPRPQQPHPASMPPQPFIHPSRLPPDMSAQMRQAASAPPPPQLDQDARAVLMAFLRAHPEIASNPQVASSPQLMARLLDEFVRNGGMRQ